MRTGGADPSRASKSRKKAGPAKTAATKMPKKSSTILRSPSRPNDAQLATDGSLAMPGDTAASTPSHQAAVGNVDGIDVDMAANLQGKYEREILD